jgi:hypothetical protein
MAYDHFLLGIQRIDFFVFKNVTINIYRCILDLRYKEVIVVNDEIKIVVISVAVIVVIALIVFFVV